MKTIQIQYFAKQLQSIGLQYCAIHFCFALQAYHFDRDDVALKGFHHYFKKQSEEEREHAMKLMSYLNKRGGRIHLTDVRAPPIQSWNNPEEAMSAALQLERDVNEVSYYFL